MNQKITVPIDAEIDAADGIAYLDQLDGKRIIHKDLQHLKTVEAFWKEFL